MSSVEGYFPEGLSVMMESESSLSKSLGILIKLDRNVALFNLSLDPIHNKSIYNARDLTRFCSRLAHLRRGLSAASWRIHPPLSWQIGGLLRPDHPRVVIYFLKSVPTFWLVLI
jgi:hypothetical protein